jgi:hypothetical protein
MHDWTWCLTQCLSSYSVHLFFGRSESLLPSQLYWLLIFGLCKPMCLSHKFCYSLNLLLFEYVYICSLPCAQKLSTCSCHKSSKTNTRLAIPFLQDPFKYHIHSHAYSFPSNFPIKTLYTLVFLSTRPTRPAHFILLNLLTLWTFYEDCKSWCSSLRIFLQSAVTSFLLGPSISLGTLLSTSVPPSTWMTKFHTHIKQRALLPFPKFRSIWI